jgi:hypothetical protein
VARADAAGPFGIMVFNGGTPGATISKYAFRPVRQAARLLAERGYGRAAQLAADRRDGVAALAADGEYCLARAHYSGSLIHCQPRVS